MERARHGMDRPIIPWMQRKHPIEMAGHGLQKCVFRDVGSTKCALSDISGPCSRAVPPPGRRSAAVNGNGAWRAGVKNGCPGRPCANKTKSGACTRWDGVCCFTSLHLSFAPRALSLFFGTLPPPPSACGLPCGGCRRPGRGLRKRLPPRVGKQPPCVKL